MTVRQLLDIATERLREEKIADASSDAAILLECVTGVTKNDIYIHPDKNVSDEDVERLNGLLPLRINHKPVQYITGTAQFMGLEFTVDERVLIPRFDTEILVEEGMKLGLSGLKILDLCTGSGCILLSLLHYSHDCTGTGTDISRGALEVARLNADRLGIDAMFLESDLFEGLKTDDKYDLIVSNPPYIRSDVIPTLMEEVKDHEPMIALDGSADGLMFYRRIISEAPAFLHNEGVLMVEIGYDQGEDVSRLFEEAGYEDVSVIRDLGGLDRVVKGMRHV